MKEIPAKGCFISGSQKVDVRLCVHQVLAVDLEEETFTMEFDLFFRWQDPRLRRADRATKACSGRFARFDHTVKCNRMCLTGIGLPEFGFRLTAKSEGREAAKDFLLWRAYSERARARISSKWKVLKNLWLQVAYVASKPLSFASNSPVAKEQALGSFLCKEEPDFEAFGQLFGTSNKLNLAKLMEEPIVLTEHQRLTDGENGETVLFRKMKATFKENMELRRFPFDRQILQFTVTAALPVQILRLEVDEALSSICRVKDLPEYVVDQEEQQEWTLKAKPTSGNASGKEYSQLRAMIFIERKPRKYIINVVVMVYLLVLASFSNFTVEVQSPGCDRISNTITFVLTIMALKYVINDQLPSKQYQTLLDIYLLASYVFLILPAVEMLMLHLWLERAGPTTHSWEVAESLDKMFALGLFGLWNAVHLLFLGLYTCDSACFHQPWEQVRDHQDDAVEAGSCASDVIEATVTNASVLAVRLSIKRELDTNIPPTGVTSKNFHSRLCNRYISQRPQPPQIPFMSRALLGASSASSVGLLVHLLHHFASSPEVAELRVLVSRLVAQLEVSTEASRAGTGCQAGPGSGWFADCKQIVKGDFDGDPVSARDALATGEGFVDAFCPPALLKCGADEGDEAITVQALVVREVDGKLVLAVPASAWHRKVSKRALPKGFLTKVAAAEVAACAASDRGSAVEGVALRVWFGLVEPAAEGALEISEEVASVSFGSLPGGLDRLARMISSLPGVKVPEAKGQARAKSKAAPKAAAKPQVVRGSLDPSVAAAAKAAGVPPATLAEFERLLGQPAGSRFAPEPALPTAADPLESEDDGGAGGAAGSGYPALRPIQPQESSQAEQFAAAMFKMMEGYSKGQAAKTSPLERAMDGVGGGSGEGSGLPAGRRNASARRALREALVSTPAEISSVIERLMQEDMAFSAPGVGVTQQTSARAWLEHRSRVGPYPTARARLNVMLMVIDQMSVDKRSWTLASELTQSFRLRDQGSSSSGSLAYSRLLDARWAEVSLTQFREQMDFSERRQKLQKGQAAPPNPDLVSETNGEAAAAAPGAATCLYAFCAEERLLLYRALADSERLVVAEPPPGREKFGAGLFCVPKSAEKDRLILDARPANSLEEVCSRWTRTLASASAVTSIILEPGQILLLAGADLKDCFYQFQDPPGRIRRNLLADHLSHEEAAFVFRVPVESFRGLLSVGLVIDDLIFLEKALARLFSCSCNNLSLAEAGVGSNVSGPEGPPVGCCMKINCSIAQCVQRKGKPD
ncbi:unnamed protein product [Symbiodinium microadriaticum]|nr:unnamed protein product [Symbiodinium microadriaticum]